MAHSKAEFLARFGGVYAPWVAEAVWPGVERGEFDRLGVVSAAMRETVEAADREARLALIQGQALASDALRAELRIYRARFGFPFVAARRGLDEAGLAAALRQRLRNPPEVEFETAMAQLHRIASFRLADLFSARAA